MTIEESHRIVREIAREKTNNLTPEACQLFTSLDIKKHFTFVFFPDEIIKEKVGQYARELSEIDDSLVLNQPGHYHSTLFHCPYSNDANAMLAAVESTVKRPLHFKVENLVATPEGISINVCPLEMEFIDVRRQLYSLANFDFVENDRGLST